jgi:hypothetical protein
VTGACALDLLGNSKLRCDANLRYLYTGRQKLRGARRKNAGKVDLAAPTQLLWVRQVQPGIDLYTAVVWHVSLKRQIRLAYLLDRRQHQTTSYAVLFSTEHRANCPGHLPTVSLAFSD